MCYTPADGVPGLSVSSCDRHVVEDRVTVALVGLSVMTWRSERSERHDIDLLFQCCVQVFKGKHGAALSVNDLLLLPDDGESVLEFRGHDPIDQLKHCTYSCHRHLEGILKHKRYLVQNTANNIILSSYRS